MTQAPVLQTRDQFRGKLNSYPNQLSSIGLSLEIDRSGRLPRALGLPAVTEVERRFRAQTQSRGASEADPGSGSRTRKLAPDAVSSSSTVPLWETTTFCTTERPSPVPFSFNVKNGVKIFSREPGS